MLDGHPLGSAGRARGEEHVGEVPRLRVRRGRHGVRREAVEEQRPARGGDLPRQPLLSHHDAHAGVLQHQGQALGREHGIERHVRGSRLEDAQQARDHLGRALREQSHPVGAHAQLAQEAGDPAGEAVELAVAQHALLGDNGRGLGVAPRLLLEAAVDGAAGSRARGRVVELPEELVPLGLAEQRQVPERRGGSGQRAAEQGAVLVRDPEGLQAAEALDLAPEAVPLSDQAQLQLATLEVGPQVEEREGAAVEARRGRPLRQLEPDGEALLLEDRVLLPLDRLGPRAVHPLRQAGEALVPAQTRPDGQRPGEGAQGTLELLVLAAVEDLADQDVGFARETPEEDLPEGQQQGGGRDAERPRPVLDLPRGPGREVERQRSGGERAGQDDAWRGRGVLPAPVLPPLLGVLLLQQLALPLREVGVRQRLPRGLPAGPQRLVGGADLRGQVGEGPGVRAQRRQLEQQDMLRLTEAEQRALEHRTVLQVERLGHQPPEALLPASSALLPPSGLEILDHRLERHLEAPAAAEGGAQDLLARHHQPHRSPAHPGCGPRIARERHPPPAAAATAAAAAQRAERFPPPGPGPCLKRSTSILSQSSLSDSISPMATTILREPQKGLRAWAISMLSTSSTSPCSQGKATELFQ